MPSPSRRDRRVTRFDHLYQRGRNIHDHGSVTDFSKEAMMDFPAGYPVFLSIVMFLTGKMSCIPGDPERIDVRCSDLALRLADGAVQFPLEMV